MRAQPAAAAAPARCVRTSATHPIRASEIVRVRVAAGGDEGRARGRSPERRAHTGDSPRDASLDTGRGSGSAADGEPSGALLVSYMPGKRVVARRHRGDEADWERSLHDDLVRLRDAYGVRVIVCMLNDAELRYLGVRADAYASECTQLGIELVCMPVVEMAAPEPKQTDAARALVADIAQRMRERGETVLVHCRGGVGRSGMLAACVLLQLGVCSSARAAIALVRRMRCPDAVESRAQERFVDDFAAWLRTRET